MSHTLKEMRVLQQSRHARSYKEATGKHLAFEYQEESHEWLALGFFAIGITMLILVLYFG